MPRATKEWVGPTPDTPPPPRVRARVFAEHKGICHVTKRKIMVGDEWQLDHVIALVNGGENREGNLAPVLVEAHRRKTAQDVAQKAKDARVYAKHIGAAPKPRNPLPGGKGSKWKKKVDGTVVLREGSDSA